MVTCMATAACCHAPPLLGSQRQPIQHVRPIITIQTYQQAREQTRAPSNLKQAPQMVSSYRFNEMTK